VAARRVRLFPILVGVALVLFVVATKYRDFNSSARVGRARLADLAAQQIVSIRLEPTKYKPAITAPIDVTDRESVAALAAALSHLDEHEPNHPHALKAVIVRIRFKDREIGGLLQLTSNDGTTFYYMSEIEKGWVFGTYLVPHGEALFDQIAGLAAQAKR